MENKYPTLFSALKVKNMILPNRLVMTAMGTNLGGESGQVNPDHIAYYSERAKGGTGLIIVENINVDYPLGSNGTTQIRIDHDRYIPALSKLVDSVHTYGTKISIQLNHAGASAVSSRIDGLQAVSSSDVPSKKGGGIPRPLKIAEIDRIVLRFGEAAKRAQIAGFDAVEIHGGHAYLLCQFISKHFNKRTDEYGGSAENRARFAKRVLGEIKKTCGPDFPVMLRVSLDEYVPDGNGVEDTIETMKFLDADVDMYNVSAGLNETLQYQIDMMPLAEGWRSAHARLVKETFKKPTIAVGSIRTPPVAEGLLAAGDCDLIGIGRGLIAEPKWAFKVRHGQEKLLRRCVSCNIGCAGNRIYYNKPIKCTINPDIIHDEEYKKRRLIKPTNVVVIGAGVAGLEAACTAAEVGCTTFLIEEQNELGGLAEQISRIPDKSKIRNFMDYMENRCASIENLFVLKGTKARTDIIDTYKPDIVVNATGSKPLLPPIPGLRERVDAAGSRVMTIKKLMATIGDFRELKDKRIVVIGGGAVGMDVVEFFAPHGNPVTIVERLPELAKDLDPLSRQAVFALLDKHGVNTLTSTSLMEVKDQQVMVNGIRGDAAEASTYALDFDYCFVCLGMTSSNEHVAGMIDHYLQRDVEFLNIGDSSRARKIIAACEEGRNILLTLDRLGRLA